MADPLTTEQAKAALIQAADRLDPVRRAADEVATLVKRRPGAAVATLVGIGMFLGRSPKLRRGASKALAAYVRSRLPRR
jgi:hypothetical protein